MPEFDAFVTANTELTALADDDLFVIVDTSAGDSKKVQAVNMPGRLFTEQASDPAAPATDTAVLYAKDNGDAVTTLYRRNTTDVQQIATIDSSGFITATTRTTTDATGTTRGIAAGTGNGTGAGGSLTVRSGTGGSGGNGGQATFKSGNAGGGNKNGGLVVVNTGSGTGSGSGGAMSIFSGDGGTTGNGGTVSITPGAGNGGGTNGSTSLLDSAFNTLVKIGPTANTLAFFGGAGSTKPTVTGSRGGNAALASLLTALAGLGLITDSTSA